MEKIELFNIYSLKINVYPHLDMSHYVKQNKAYFKDCNLAQFILKLQKENII